MKKILLICISFITGLWITLPVYACGGIAHMFIAKESIPLLHDAKLRNLILNNLDAYLVGSNYPDTGYIKGTEYGEDSHWEPFISAYIAYLHQHYAYPDLQNPKLVAFILGVASHSKADIIFHSTLLNVITEKDYAGDRDKAHSDSELGIDVMILMDKNQWQLRPSTWWYPLDELVQIYQSMGKNTYTSKQVILGNSLYSTAGVGEISIAPAAYPILILKMPWTAKNYYDTPQGGIAITERASADYIESVWNRIV